MLLITNPISSIVYTIIFSFSMLLLYDFRLVARGLKSVVPSKTKFCNWVKTKITIQVISLIIFIVFFENKLIMFLLHITKLTELYLCFSMIEPNDSTIYYIITLFGTSCDLHSLLIVIPYLQFTLKMANKSKRIKKTTPNYVRMKQGKDEFHNYSTFILAWIFYTFIWFWVIKAIDYFWLQSNLKVY